MLEFILWIIFWTIIGIALLCITAYLILPWVFKIFVSPLFNASYKYDSSDFDDKEQKLEISKQINQPEIIINENDGSYTITFGQERKFTEGGIYIRHNGKSFANIRGLRKKHKKLKLTDIKKEKMDNKLGSGEQTTLQYLLDNSNVKIELKIKDYTQNSFIIFTLTVPNGLENTSTGNFDDLIVSFPSFFNKSPNTNVFTYRHAIFCPPSRKIDTTSAPVILYDDELNCVILSPLDGFLNAAISEEKNGRISCGIQGEITKLPKEYSQSFILYFSKGINKPMEEIGELLLKYHDSTRKSQYADLLCSHLGFWTDNGAYYYYKTEKGMSYEDTLVTVREYFDMKNIPIRYFNFDSWWYLKHTNKAFTTIFRPIVRLMGGGLYGNTIRWETDPEKFSTDLKTFYEERFKLPITAHNRRWDARSPYLKNYEFITYKNHACPLKQEFWNWLMQHAKESGIIVYEQDWMKNQIEGVPQLRQNINAIPEWLNSMAVAAKEQGINVFYCMQTPGILLYSVKHPNITITRCSGDYNHRWPLTYRYVHSTQTNIIIHAAGLNSHPDVFRSRSMEDSLIRPFGEKYPIFKCLYQILNAGVVAPGDKKENVNWDLLKKTCRDDGLLLKPDKPLTANDLMFKKHRKYYICDTYVKRNDLYWRLVLISNIWPHRVKEYYFTADELGFNEQEFLLYDYFDDKLNKISREEKIQIGKLKKYAYKYYILAPILSNGMAVIGDTRKFVPCSRKEFSDIVIDKNTLKINITELEGEAVPILIYSEKIPKTIELEAGKKIEKGKGENQWSYNEKSKRLSITLSFQESATKTLVLKTI
ncbi:MAG: hypothetical protein EU541_05310 [Promethearchaeota archaeon]|nr:MAG: hypothetical protein EU541_05310 [Candidatus Lokiarchaeota archaeon]